MPREKLIFRADASKSNTAEVFLEGEDGQRIKLTGVVELSAHAAPEPFVRVTMYVREADLEVVLPEQTGELLKVVATLEAAVEAWKVAARGA